MTGNGTTGPGRFDATRWPLLLSAMNRAMDQSQGGKLKIQPVILCGGSGTRLWPLSREQHPKQLLALDGGDSTLLQQTIRRMDGLESKLAPPAAPVLLCSEDYRFLVADQLRAIGM